MIDDIKQLHQRDKEDILGAIAGEWSQLLAAVEYSPRVEGGAIGSVVCAGMGGSAVAAMIVASASACTVPFEIARDYDIPHYVDQRTLFIACSSSGNTEEIIEAIAHAAEQGARIAVITSGGVLEKVAAENKYPLVIVPKMRHSRFAAFYVLKALVTLLVGSGVSSIAVADLEASAAFLQDAVAAWLPTVPAKRNVAKQIAQECMGRSIVIYSGPKFAAAAYRWKMDFNESAKQVAWTGVLPEFNHNEFVGWSGQPEQKPYAVVELRSNLDHPRVQKRFEVTERLLSGMRPSPIVVQTKGATVLEQLLWAVMLGDFAAAYLAVLNGYDPASLVIVDKLKHALG